MAGLPPPYRSPGAAIVIDPRVGRLRRMRFLATGLLVAMAAAYLASSIFITRAPWLGPIRAFCEAAVVGACADWFAVTALFRRPFGLPLPHTAIIPNAKDRIGEALGQFIVDNFLSPRTLDAKLRDFELAAWGGGWLRQPENARAVAARSLKLLMEIRRSLPQGELEAMAEAIFLAAAKAIPAAPTGAALLEALWVEDRVQLVIGRLAAILEDYLRRNQEVVLKKVQSQSWRWLPAFIDKAIAAKITSGVIQLLADVQAPDHPWRLELSGIVKTWIGRLAADPLLRAEGEAMKMQMLADPSLRQHARRLWTDVERQFMAGLSQGSDELVERLARTLQMLGAWLADDPMMQRSLNTSARALVRRVVAPRRHEIGRFVAQVVQSWDASTIVGRLELQVGPELQFIRLNGTLVGGLVGLILYVCSKLSGLH